MHKFPSVAIAPYETSLWKTIVVFSRIWYNTGSCAPAAKPDHHDLTPGYGRMQKNRRNEKPHEKNL